MYSFSAKSLINNYDKIQIRLAANLQRTTTATWQLLKQMLFKILIRSYTRMTSGFDISKVREWYFTLSLRILV